MTEREIFLAVIDLSDPTARSAYLAKACGSNRELRGKVEALLSSHESAGSFLGVPAVAAAAANSSTQLVDENSTPYDVTVSRAGADRQATDDDEVPLGFLAPAQRPDSLGRIGHYEVLQVLGKGGFGIVFRAFDDVLQRVVAVKVMAPQLAATSPARKRFLREARSSAQVRHEHVVQVYEIGEQPLPYLSMEFIPGETLQQRLDRTGPLEVLEVVRIGRQIAEGLAAAHATDLIHRDIKPSNILLESGHEKAKLTDFGLARAADDASISQSGIIAGTPMYMAPEQAKGDKLDQRADVFSLGSVLYQMAAGRPPFRANGTVAVLKRVAEDTPRDIREIIPETPQWLCDIIAKLHEKKPDDRFQSAREVADVLADCEAQLKANAKLKDYSRIPRSKARPSGRRKWVAAAAVLLLPLLVLAATEIAGVTHLLRGRPTTDPTPDGWGPVAPTQERVALEFDGDADYVATPLVYDGSTPLTVEATVQIREWPVHISEIMSNTELGGFGIGTAKQGFYICARIGDRYVSVYSPKDDRYLNRPVRLAAVIDDKVLRLFLDGKQVGETSIQQKFNPSKQKISLGTSPGDRTPHDGNGYEWAGTLFEVRISNVVRYTSDYEASALLTADEHTLALYRFDEGSGDVLNDSSGNGRHGKIIGARWVKAAGPPTGSPPVTSSPPTFTNSIGMEFVIVPKGKSWLGGGKDKLGDKEVAIPADFYLGKYEVTQEEWEKVMGENPSHFSRTGEGKDAVKDIPDADLKRFPVENVSWDQCQIFVAKLNQREKEKGWVYRLPTEAEWTYACRGGPMADQADSAFDFYLSVPTNTLPPAQANFDKGLNRTCKVGSYPSNTLGLYEMHGNVWEYCDKPLQDPEGMRAVSRGGSWRENPNSCRANVYGFGPPGLQDDQRGLRLARVPAGAPSPEAKTPPLAKQEPLPATFKNNLGMEFVIVPKGKSWLGGGKDKPGNREVEIPADFYLGKYEVTQEEWTQVMGENPSWFSRTGDGKQVVKDIADADLKRFPVEYVSWEDCQLFLAKLNQREKEAGWVYRLPKNSEWEYACRGGPMLDKRYSAFDFYFAKPTNSLLPEQANYTPTGLKRSHKVGSFAPNALGIFDMHGNVAEWCHETWTLPTRILHGGCWHDESVSCTAVFGGVMNASGKNHGYGLRLARVPSGATSPETKTPPVVANVLKDAALLMNFEKDTFYEKDGKTYARDLSGNGNDGLCENVEFSPDGKAGGGLLCKDGRLQLSKSLINHQPNYTITAWCRWDKRTGRGKRTSLYQTCQPDLTNCVFDIFGTVYVHAWNRNLLPQNWKNARTDARTVPAGWFFVAVSLADGEIDKGKLRIVIDDKIQSLTSQMVATTGSPVDMVGLLDGAVIDELAVFQRALSDEEIAAVRALGLKGTPSTVGQAPPAVAPFTDADVKRIAALPAAEQVEEVRKELIKRNPRFDGTLTPTIVSGYVHGLKFHTGEVDDIAPLRALKTLTSLDCGCSSESRGKLSDLSPLKDLPLTWLELSYNLVKDLAPLEGMRLTYLVLDYSPNVSDLSPLKGMPLTRLGMGATRVTDLTPLEGMKLDFLNLWTTPVRNLEALKGMPITNLNIDRTGVTNLTPLQGMNLNEIHLIPRNISQGLDVLRNMQSLKTIGTSVNPFPAAEFWERYDKGEFGFAPFSDAEVKRIAALPAAEQIEEVRKELMRRNPSFDGIVEHKIEGDTVIELRINTDKVTDIAPIRVFSTLRVLDCGASYTDKPNGLLAELSSLNGMNLSALTHLNLNQTKIDDAGLANFKDCKNLLELRLWNTKSTDTGLANFKGCNKLTSLDLGGTQVSDAGLANFKDCKDLTALYLHWTKMSDAGLVHFLDCKDLTQISLAGTRLSDAGLAQIKNCKYLKHLSLDHMKIGDTGLAHFKDIPLTSLWIDNTGITDLTPLQVMPLEAIHLTPKNIKKGLDVLRDMKSLKTIGIAWKQEWPATEFWERYDKGEFTK